MTPSGRAEAISRVRGADEDRAERLAEVLGLDDHDAVEVIRAALESERASERRSLNERYGVEGSGLE